MARPTKGKSAAEMDLSWDRQFRPTRLPEYLGNKITVESIKARLANNKLAHTMAFTGQAGSGKTSMARLLTVELRCQSKVNGMACGVCDTCVATVEKYIKKAEPVQGIMELNMSDESGKDVIKKVIDYASSKPVGLPCSIVILDEVHQASAAAQNALLKLAEEPKPYFYLFLCTTDPQKLISPLKSRCQIIHVYAPTTEEVQERLELICREKKVQFTQDALKLIVRKAKRVPRDSIKFLETVASVAPVTVENVTKILEVAEYELWVNLFDYMANKDLGDVLNYVDSLQEKDVTEEIIMRELPEFMNTVIDITNNVNVDIYTQEFTARVKSVFKKVFKNDLEMLFVVEQIQKAMTIANHRFALNMLAGKIKNRAVYLKGLTAEEELRKEKAKADKIQAANYNEFLSATSKEDVITADNLMAELGIISIVE